MEGEAFVRLEKLLGRELEQSEKERLQRIQDVLKIGPNDALWSIIAALEYQRAYYEELPQKIRTATEEILAEWSEAARKNAAAPQKTKLKKAGEPVRFSRFVLRNVYFCNNIAQRVLFPIYIIPQNRNNYQTGFTAGYIV